MNTQDCRDEIMAKSTVVDCPTYPVYCRVQFEHEERRCHSSMREYYQATNGNFLCPGCEEIVSGTYREFYFSHLSHLCKYKFLKQSILTRKRKQAKKLAKEQESTLLVKEQVKVQESEEKQFKAPIAKGRRVERGTGTADRGEFQNKVASPHPCNSRKRLGDVKIFPIFEKQMKNIERTLLPTKVKTADGFSLGDVTADDGLTDGSHLANGSQDDCLQAGGIQDSGPQVLGVDQVADPTETRSAVNVIEDLLSKWQNGAGNSRGEGGIDVDSKNYASFCAPLVKKKYVAPVKSINIIDRSMIVISDSDVSPTYDENEVEDESFLQGSVVDSKDYENDEDMLEDQKVDDVIEDQNHEDQKKDVIDGDDDMVDEKEKGENSTKVANLDCIDSLAVLIANVLGQEKSLTSHSVRQNLKEAFTGDESQCQQMQKVIVKALDDVIVVKEMELKGIRNLRAAAVLIGKVMRDRRATENLVTENMKALLEVLRK